MAHCDFVETPGFGYYCNVIKKSIERSTYDAFCTREPSRCPNLGRGSGNCQKTFSLKQVNPKKE